MVSAYIDESGIHENAKICVVAGYYGFEDAWNAFDYVWNKVLVDFGVPHFHSVQFWAKDKAHNRVGPYANWKDERADVFLERLLLSIEGAQIHPVGSGIVVNEWKRFPIEPRRWLTGAVWNGRKFKTNGSPSKPYYVPFQICILEPAKFMEPNTIQYFFGLDKNFAGHAQQMYNEMKELKELPERDQLGNIAFPLSKDVPGLQAADLLTYCFYKHCNVRLGRESEMPDILKRLTSRERPQQKYGLLRTADLERMVQISQKKYHEKMRRIHESSTCEACGIVQSQRHPQRNSEDFEGTLHRAEGTKAHTLFRYGRYIESESQKNTRLYLDGKRRPVFDPRKEES